MVKLVSLFNHKGGVSKTTITSHLGWALAMQSKRVLIIDADPQCLLTGIVLGLSGDNDFEAFYTSHPRTEINPEARSISSHNRLWSSLMFNEVHAFQETAAGSVPSKIG
jgi:cellulose biosynthesis protein BcsQ